ncbi:S8 family serine peptidase [Cellulomonas sp. NPDC089187]|uniref:S8 family peptidase n=1 Tax=Cellulomonas sp. NPDC089187 TaxID=3154970 RepID=UPI0034167EC9
MAVVLAGALVLSGGQAASASSGDWYYDDGGFEEIHERADGSGIRIAVLDTQINPTAPELAEANLNVREDSYCWDADMNPLPATATGDPGVHATSMIAMISGTGDGINGQPGIRGIAPGAEVDHYAAMLPDSAKLNGENCAKAHEDGLSASNAAFRDALESGANIISISAWLTIDSDWIARAVAAGVIVVAAVGNEGIQWIAHPASYNGVVAVGSYGPEYLVSEFSNTGKELGVVAPGEGVRSYTTAIDGYKESQGTSYSAAYVSGALALAWSAFPDASSNQILQLLVHNTGSQGATHEPVRDQEVGYGSLNIKAMLSDDPNNYEHEHPFVTEDNTEGPSVFEIEEARDDLIDQSVPTVSPTTSTVVANDAEPQSGDGSKTAVYIGVGVGVAILVFGVTLAVILVRRRQSVSSSAMIQEKQ